MQDEMLGVDFGGVITDRVNAGTDTSFFSDNYLRTTATPGSFRVLRELVERRFGSSVYLISKCGPKVQAKTLRWLEHHCFYAMTLVPEANVRFCMERHEKAGICRELRVTHFIDDRLEVLGHLAGIVSHRYLYNPQEKEVRRFSQFLPHVRRVETWDEILADLVPSRG